MAEKAAAWFAGRDITQLVSSPLERAQQTAAPLAKAIDLPVTLDERLIEAGNAFEGTAVAGGAGVFRAPRNWWKLRNPFQPSWGEPYVEIAARMLAAVEAARDAARGHEAVLVSHQLPIWTVRLHVEGRRYLHDPRRRQCALASVTSLTYDGDRLSEVSYAEPAGATDPDAVPGA
jgi:broad specificity phosphatase PhoE